MVPAVPPPLGCLDIREGEWRRMRGDTKAVQKKSHTSFVKSYLSNHCIQPTLGKRPPPLSEEESVTGTVEGGEISSTRKVQSKSGKSKSPSGEFHQVQ
uniref:Uncharacterized protein n=1 Tax=Caenorhabditis japonica TaxID=281687 RepID=A0A8R1E5R4_CAEJA